MDASVFVDDTTDLVRILVSAPVLYIAVIASIRVVGKRATSQMNNFDWVVTVAMGSLVASGIILPDITVAETVLAMALLLILQYAVTKLLPHSQLLCRLVKAEPRLLLRDGEFLRQAMRDDRVVEGEILAAIREAGLRRLDAVEAVILETDASLSVIAKSDDDAEPTALTGVAGWTSTDPGP